MVLSWLTYSSDRQSSKASVSLRPLFCLTVAIPLGRALKAGHNTGIKRLAVTDAVLEIFRPHPVCDKPASADSPWDSHN